VVVYIYRVRIFKGSHEKYVARAEQLMAEGKYKEAGESLYEAIKIKRTDPGLFVMLGDAWMHLAKDDPEALRKGRGAWESAVSIDPRYLPALQRIFKMEQDIERAYPQPRSMENVREAAKKLLAVDPADKPARQALHGMVIERWSAGVQVDPHELDEAIEGLTQLMKEDPTNSDLPFYVARTKIVRSEDARRQRDDAGAKQLTDDAIKVMQDALAAQPNNAGLLYRTSQIYWYLASPARKGTDEEQKKYDQLARETLEKARAAA
jgi:tetratricopeptide (TPR) repeat protein